MTTTYRRIKAGEYNLYDSGKRIGRIQKSYVYGWVYYQSDRETPIGYAHTLKVAKYGLLKKLGYDADRPTRRRNKGGRVYAGETHKRAIILESDFKKVKECGLTGIKGISRKCVSTGRDRKTAYAHAHCHPNASHKGWICFFGNTPLFVNGKPSTTLLHEYAHIMTESGHTPAWRRYFQRLLDDWGYDMIVKNRFVTARNADYAQNWR